MMREGLVSVIVTCYNQEHCIVRTLENVAQQTYSDFECIVVDDESTDNSNQIVKAFIKNDSRFKIIRQTNKGLAGSRNTGFRHAQGEYIQFLDGDDTLHPDKFRIQIEAFSKNKKAMICLCNYCFFIESTKSYKYHKFEKLEPQPLEQLIYKWNAGVSFTQHAPLYKRAIWAEDEVPYQEDYHYWCEDWVFNVLLAMRGHEYIILDEVLCNYHMHDENYTADKKALITSAIHAAMYLHPKLPMKYQTDFIERTVDNLLKMYKESEKIKILRASGNWRLGNALTSPLVEIIKYGRKKV
jgi:glycosyltransferase involved in cell wall biosynthesis